MSCILDNVPVVNPRHTRPTANLSGVDLDVINGHVLLHLVTGKKNATRIKTYHVEEIETQLGGRAFRLTPASGCDLAGGETDYVVLLHGPDSSCTCPGFQWSQGCKHLSSLLHFQSEGRLERTVAL